MRLIPDAQRKKNQLAVRLTDEELHELEKISNQEGLPLAYFLREGVIFVIQKYRQQ
jgi:predicted DNA-binding protein